MTTTHAPTGAPVPAVHPLLLPGAVREIVQVCGGKRIYTVLPEVQAALDSIVNDSVQDAVDEMEAGT